jgi:hypothetical protein
MLLLLAVALGTYLPPRRRREGSTVGAAALRQAPYLIVPLLQLTTSLLPPLLPSVVGIRPITTTTLQRWPRKGESRRKRKGTVLVLVLVLVQLGQGGEGRRCLRKELSLPIGKVMMVGVWRWTNDCYLGHFLAWRLEGGGGW